MAWLKRFWWALVLVVLPLVVIAAGLLVARSVDDEKNRVAVYAAVVATVGIVVSGVKNAYDVWEKERERLKKEDDKREILKPASLACRSFGTLSFTLGIELFNDGKATVPIKHVHLVVKWEGKEKVVAMVGPQSKKVTLEPHGHAWFSVPSMSMLYDGDRGPLASEEMFIVVESYKNTEVLRVPDEMIRATLVKAMNRPDEKSGDR